MRLWARCRDIVRARGDLPGATERVVAERVEGVVVGLELAVRHQPALQLRPPPSLIIDRPLGSRIIYDTPICPNARAPYGRVAAAASAASAASADGGRGPRRGAGGARAPRRVQPPGLHLGGLGPFLAMTPAGRSLIHSPGALRLRVHALQERSIVLVVFIERVVVFISVAREASLGG